MNRFLFVVLILIFMIPGLCYSVEELQENSEREVFPLSVGDQIDDFAEPDTGEDE